MPLMIRAETEFYNSVDAENSVLYFQILFRGTRIYAKSVNNGKSKYNLSDEEQSALEKAMKILPGDSWVLLPIGRKIIC